MKQCLLRAWLLTVAASSAVSSAAHGGADIAYVSLRTGDPNIYVRDGKGNDQMLTKGVGVHTQPAISVDGRLAYVLQVNGVPTIHTMSLDGTSPMRLTTSGRGEFAPSWSPDGNSLAFLSMAMDTGVQELHIFDIGQVSTIKIVGPGTSMGPAPASWSADGKRLTVLASDEKGRNQVFLIELGGTSVQDISSKFAPRGAESANLSPDGLKVVWVADLRNRRPLVITDIATGVSKDLTDGEAVAHETPRWSPDGKQIAFVSARGSADNQRSDVYVMDADGTHVRNVSQHPHEDFDPRWSADGRSIIFASLRNGNTQLFEAGLDGGVIHQLSQHRSHDLDHVVRPLAAAR